MILLIITLILQTIDVSKPKQYLQAGTPVWNISLCPLNQINIISWLQCQCFKNLFVKEQREKKTTRKLKSFANDPELIRKVCTLASSPSHVSALIKSKNSPFKVNKHHG